MASLLSVSNGCTRGATAPIAAAPVAEVQPRKATPQQGHRALSKWKTIDGTELPVRVRVPFASEWERRETRTSLRLEHPGERVRVVIRLWPASRLVTADQCLNELGLLEPELGAVQKDLRSMPDAEAANTMPDGEAASSVVSRPFEPGGDFHGSLHARVGTSKADDPITGGVIAVAAGIGRCLAFVARTTAVGAMAKREIGERLVWMVDDLAMGLTVRTPQDRVPKD